MLLQRFLIYSNSLSLPPRFVKSRAGVLILSFQDSFGEARRSIMFDMFRELHSIAIEPFEGNLEELDAVTLASLARLYFLAGRYIYNEAEDNRSVEHRY